MATAPQPVDVSIHEYWRVDDSNGKYHGTFSEQRTAGEIARRVEQENDAIGFWVAMTKVRTIDGPCH